MNINNAVVTFAPKYLGMPKEKENWGLKRIVFHCMIRNSLGENSIQDRDHPGKANLTH